MKVFMRAVVYNLGVKARALHIAPSEEMMERACPFASCDPARDAFVQGWKKAGGLLAEQEEKRAEIVSSLLDTGERLPVSIVFYPHSKKIGVVRAIRAFFRIELRRAKCKSEEPFPIYLGEFRSDEAFALIDALEALEGVVLSYPSDLERLGTTVEY